MNTPRVSDVWILVLGLGIGGCGDVEATYIEHREFLSESVEGYTLPPATRVHLNFYDPGHFSAYVSCNDLSGEYRMVDEVFDIGSFGLTEGACGVYGAPDDWLFPFLQAHPRFIWEDPRLTLYDDDTTLVLLDRTLIDPDRPLLGALWTVQGLIEGEVLGSFQSSRPGTLVLREGGVLELETPCASGSGTFVEDPSRQTLALGNISIGEAVCPSEEFAGHIDAHMRRVLVDGEVTYAIDTARLTLSRGAVGLWLSTE